MDLDKAQQILNIRVGDKISYPTSIVKKSFYEFDLQTLEGITSFLTVLPITSDELLMQACAEVFPGYDTTTFDVKLARWELRGYFLDFLETQALDSVEFNDEADDASNQDGDVEDGQSETSGLNTEEEVVEDGNSTEITE